MIYAMTIDKKGHGFRVWDDDQDLECTSWLVDNGFITVTSEVFSDFDTIEDETGGLALVVKGEEYLLGLRRVTE